MWVHASQFRNRQNSYMVGDVKTVVTDWEGHQEALWGLECVLYFDLGGGYMDVHTYKNLFRCMPNICALYCSYPSFHVLKRGHQFENYCPALASVFLDIKSWVWLWFMSRLCHLSAVYLEEITEPLRTLVSHLYRRGKNSTCSIALFWEFSSLYSARAAYNQWPAVMGMQKAGLLASRWDQLQCDSCSRAPMRSGWSQSPTEDTSLLAPSCFPHTPSLESTPSLPLLQRILT